jgi:O-antigen/teichoic acid export membrane protein
MHRVADVGKGLLEKKRGGVTPCASVDRVGRGGLAAFVIYCAGIGLAYLSQLVVARVAGIDTFGLYTYVFSWIVVLAHFSALGFDVALLRFVPAYQTKRAWPLLQGVIQYAQRRVLAVGILIALIGVCDTLVWGSSLERRSTFLAGLALVPLLALLRVRCAIVRAFGGVVSSLAPDRMVREGMLIGLVGVAALGFGWTVDAPLVMLATLVGAAVGLGFTVPAIRRWRPRALSDVAPEYDALTWRRAAIPLVIVGATDVLMNRIGVILLGWIADTKDAGIFGLAFNIALVVTLPQVALNTLFAPEISGLYARKDIATMQALVTKAATWMLYAALGIGLVLFVIAEPLLAWFGDGFDAGASALRILVVGQVLVAGAGSQLYVMTMTGHERAAAVLLVCSAIANVGASFVLIGQFGLVGAAIATAAVLVVWNVVMAIFLWRRLGLLPGVLSFARLPLNHPKAS